MEYSITVPKAGNYKLYAQTSTVNEKQTLRLSDNGATPGSQIALPFSLGMWKESVPVTLTLNEGVNILHFWRDQAPQYGVAIKSFTLRPESSED